MRLTPGVKGFLISLLAAIIAFGIYFLFLKKENHFLVDNPTPQTYYFKLNNGAEMIVSAGQYVPVSLSNGRNRISVMNAEKKVLYDSAFNVTGERGLLNIAHQDYYINTQYYGYNIKKDSLLLALGNTIIDGKPFLGAPKHFTKLYTEDFYYNVDEKYDEMIKNIQKVESRSKIFRKQDFLNYYKNYYQK